MTKKHFDAIIAKNEIAREIKDYINNGMISITNITYQLKKIELYTGQGNQPQAENIINSDIEI